MTIPEHFSQETDLDEATLEIINQMEVLLTQLSSEAKATFLLSIHLGISPEEAIVLMKEIRDAKRELIEIMIEMGQERIDGRSGQPAGVPKHILRVVAHILGDPFGEANLDQLGAVFALFSTAGADGRKAASSAVSALRLVLDAKGKGYLVGSGTEYRLRRITGD